MPHAFGRTICFTTTAAEPITYTVNGYAMAIVAPLFRQGGTADVYVDGSTSPVRSINFGAASTEPGRLVFSWSWFYGGRHTVELRPTSGEIDLDALLVLSPA